MNGVVKRFLEYVAYGTASDHNSEIFPSTESQMVFAHALKKECDKLGFDSVTLSEDGYLYCFLNGTDKGAGKSVGFIAHMDTSPDFCGNGVKPRIVKYDGGDIRLNNAVSLSPKSFSSLDAYVGDDLIVTDGTTLLGADDKAGIAEILTAIEYVIENRLDRPDIYVAFTPDEEIGRGMDRFDISVFRPDFAYTVDGGGACELEYECFNAARAKISIKGEAVHPGYAKGIMKNASLIAHRLISLLPEKQIPAETDGYEGFFHVANVHSNVSEAEISILIRDFDKQLFEDMKKLIIESVRIVNEEYGNRAELHMSDEYFNMGEIISRKMEVVDIAAGAYRAAGIEPVIKPVRGGTDGARLSFMGVPCPNIFTGGHNFHGPYEYIPLKSMEAAVSVIVNIIKMI